MTDPDVRQAADLLNQLTPGYLPEPIFVAIARLAVLTAIEFIPLRFAADGSGVEVLLLPRPDSDPIWPGAMHTPGTIVRPTDTTFTAAQMRLVREELGLNELPPLIANGTNLIECDRGRGVTMEFIAVMDNIEPVQGVFYNCNDLPKNFVAELRPVIDRAVIRFVAEYGPVASPVTANQLH